MTAIQLPPSDSDLRQAAIIRLRKKRDLQAHVIAFATVNLLLIGIWLLTGHGGFFWPLIPLLAWGIGVAFHIWDIYSPEQPSEARIQQEMRHLHDAR